MINSYDTYTSNVYAMKPRDIYYLPTASKKIKEFVTTDEKTFPDLSRSEKNDLAYTCFIDLMDSDESMACDILMSEDVKTSLASMAKGRVCTADISGAVLDEYEATICNIFSYYKNEYQSALYAEYDL